VKRPRSGQRQTTLEETLSGAKRRKQDWEDSIENSNSEKIFFCYFPHIQKFYFYNLVNDLGICEVVRLQNWTMSELQLFKVPKYLSVFLGVEVWNLLYLNFNKVRFFESLVTNTNCIVICMSSVFNKLNVLWMCMEYSIIKLSYK